MYKIRKTTELADQLVLMEVEAPRVAKNCQPGQFVIVRLDEQGERIPLTICDYNRQEGTITIVFQAVGVSTKKMLALQPEEGFKDFVGPLGCPSTFIHEDLDTLKKKKLIFVAGGVGAAPIYPQVKWLHQQGIQADVIVGSRNSELLILEEELRAVSRNLYIATDDGSLGHHGRVTDVLENLVKEEGRHYDECIAIGPMIMMKFVSLLTKELNIPTTVSMNPIMIDGTGMCGGCRLTVDGQVKFACVDGPEFDGHQVDFDEAMKRMQIYKTQENLKIKHAHPGGCCGGETA